VSAIPRYRPHAGPAVLSAGFRPFFLLAAAWAAVAIPLWLALFTGGLAVPTALPPVIWHVHEMVYGYGAAVVAGFLLTAIPNWTGRMPLQGAPLAGLALLWLAGRIAVLCSGAIGAAAATVLDLAFPAVFAAVIAREIITGRNWRNLPMVGALALLLAGNLVVHLDALGVAASADFGNRLGVATLVMLINLIGGRIVPSFTRNWLAREQPAAAQPAPFGVFDRAVLALVGLTLLCWLFIGGSPVAAAIEIAGGAAVLVRLARWHGEAAWREPLVWVLHLGTVWIALGFMLMGVNGLAPTVPDTTPLHALTVGAIGTMTLAVMTRASLGHTGRPLTAGPVTTAIYVLITVAAMLRLVAPLAGDYVPMLWSSGLAWSGAFGLFVVFFTPALTRPRPQGGQGRPI
jgi:uncharacterized protein involved in response to NO